MAVLSNPVITHETNLAIIAVFPRLPQMVDDSNIFHSAIETAVSMGAKPGRVCVMHPASGPQQQWFKRVKPARFIMPDVSKRLKADGVILTKSGDAAVLPTGDCLVDWTENPNTRKGGLAHCGREASRPQMSENDLPPVSISLARKIEPRRKREHLNTFLTNSICPDCFPHDDEDGQKRIQDFLDIYGEEAFSGPSTKGKLKMMSITRALLRGHGVPDSRIQMNLDCPCCNTIRASHRREGRTYRDITIAVMK